jgi:imidazolonepropionase-like amidohydrolase
MTICGVVRCFVAFSAFALPACSAAAPAAEVPETAHNGFVLANGRLVGGERLSLEIRDGTISAIGDVDGSLPIRDVSNQWIVPAAIDSHVHLTFLPVAERLRNAGVIGAVDLAAPLDALGDSSPLELVSSGPMITAADGYPTQSWGSDGYGYECGDSQCVEDAVAELVAAGAKVIKVPVGERGLFGELLDAAVRAAHGHGVLVAAHALGDSDAKEAARAGVDILAHTPVEPLTDQTVHAWSGRHVISTLVAFGGSTDVTDNLRRLRDAGATVIYGTDLGNTRHIGISREEITLLQEAGLDGEAIIESMTSAPAKLWRFSKLGAIEKGARAALLLYEEDPAANPSALASPREVIIANPD